MGEEPGKLQGERMYKHYCPEVGGQKPREMVNKLFMGAEVQGVTCGSHTC